MKSADENFVLNSEQHSFQQEEINPLLVNE
jgi:hypothetical protein